MFSKMRQIATSRKGSVFLTAEFENRVYSWDLDGFKQISEFDTILDFSGFNLAVTEDGTHCLAAASSRNRVALYDIATGAAVWLRKDVKRPYPVTFDPSNELIYMGVNKKPMLVINRNDGNDVEKIRAAQKVYFDPLASKRLFLQGRNTIVGDGVKVTSPTFAFLDIAPAGTGVALSAVGDNVMFYNYDEQWITWEFSPNKDEHFRKLAFSDESNMIYAVLFKYGGSRVQPYFLLYGMSAVDGDLKFVFGLPPETLMCGFAQNASKLICNGGEVYNLKNAEPELIHKFEWD
jgi:DNA-binding beta-propeller fold protein YncE